MTIKKKLIFNAIMSTIFIVVIVCTSVFILEEHDRKSKNITSFTIDAQAVKVLMLQHRRYEKDFFLNIGNPGKQEKYIKSFDGKSEKMHELLEHLQETGKFQDLSPEQKKWLNDLPQYFSDYVKDFKSLITKYSSKDTTPQDGNKSMSPFKANIHQLETTLDLLAAFSTESAMLSTNELGASVHHYVKTLIVLGIIVLLLSLFTALFISKSITAPLEYIQKTGASFAAGDLSQRLNADLKGELGEFATQINKMIDLLSTSFQQVKSKSITLSNEAAKLSKISSSLKDSLNDTSVSASQISKSTEDVTTNVNVMASASEEMSSNTINVSRHADEVAKAIEQINGTINEMSASINNVMGNTDEAHDVSDKARLLSKDLTDQVKNLAMA